MREDRKPFPRRVFLDTCTLQRINDYAGAIFEGEAIPPDDRLHTIPGGVDDTEALYVIFAVNERAGFQFAISPSSLAEVSLKPDTGYLRWVYDVADHWEACVFEERGYAFSGKGMQLACLIEPTRFGYLSTKDIRIVHDAVLYECDTLLTTDIRLCRNKAHLEKVLGIYVERPAEFLERIRPYIRLFL